jgi:hypothetical protein
LYNAAVLHIAIPSTTLNKRSVVDVVDISQSSRTKLKKIDDFTNDAKSARDLSLSSLQKYHEMR